MNILKFARNLLLWLLVIIAVAMAIFTVVSVSTFDKADRSLFGYKAFIVLSDSMKKTDFDAGDLALVKTVDPATLKEGDIIAYISQNPDSFGQTITHKIRALTTAEDGSPAFITYGTTTDINDKTAVTYPYILGKYQTHIPKLGYFFRFLKTPKGYFFCIFLPFMALILAECVHCFRLLQKERQRQRAHLREEREKIEQERAEAQRMMQEILAMKARLPNEDLTTENVIK